MVVVKGCSIGSPLERPWVCTLMSHISHMQSSCLHFGDVLVNVVIKSAYCSAFRAVCCGHVS